MFSRRAGATATGTAWFAAARAVAGDFEDALLQPIPTATVAIPMVNNAVAEAILNPDCENLNRLLPKVGLHPISAVACLFIGYFGPDAAHRSARSPLNPK